MQPEKKWVSCSGRRRSARSEQRRGLSGLVSITGPARVRITGLACACHGSCEGMSSSAHRYRGPFYAYAGPRVSITALERVRVTDHARVPRAWHARVSRRRGGAVAVGSKILCGCGRGEGEVVGVEVEVGGFRERKWRRHCGLFVRSVRLVRRSVSRSISRSFGRSVGLYHGRSVVRSFVRSFARSAPVSGIYRLRGSPRNQTRERRNSFYPPWRGRS